MENNHNYQLTKKGFSELKKELNTLKTVEREKNLEALKDARAQGDLSENADYDAAREDQARLEQRVKELENIIKHAEIIKEDNSNKVNIGKKVKLAINGNKPKYYTIVGTLEADPIKQKISNESPVGKAVIGHKANETVTFKTEANREIIVKIVEVK